MQSIGRRRFFVTVFFYADIDSALTRRVRQVAGSRFTHVAVSDGRCVRYRHMEGTAYVAIQKEGAPSFCRVEVPAPLEFDRDESPIDLRALRRRWRSRGATIANDCVSDTARCLRSCGFVVPGTIVTPDQLWEHLHGTEGALVSSGPARSHP